MGALETTETDALILGIETESDDPYWQALYQELLKTDLCLFAKDILGLEIGPHLVDWGNLIQDHKRIAINAARDHSKSTFFSYAYPIWRAWSEPGCEVYLFSATLDGAMEFLDIIVYGRANLKGMMDIPTLTHLIPKTTTKGKNTRLNRTDAQLTNGSRIRAIGYGKKVRGRHPKYIVADDVLNDEDMWSETVRKKNIEYFKSAITNMLTPEGQLVCVGCVTTDTWVPTEFGLRKIGELRPGARVAQTTHDLNLGVHGRLGMQRATKFWDNGLCATRLIKMSDGRKLEASLKHPVWAKTGDGEGWVRMSDLKAGQKLAVRLGTNCYGKGIMGTDDAIKAGRYVHQWSKIPESFMALDKKSTAAFLQGVWERRNRIVFESLSLARDIQTMMDNYGLYSRIERDQNRYALWADDELNGADNIRWVPIESIESGHAYTVDFVIPGDHSFVSNGLVSHNTPYHASDLWGFLRHNPQYVFKKYPGIIKDKETGKEKALFPWRWTLKRLHDKREEIGSVSFTREILCEPISDELSIFPSHLFPPLFDPVLKLQPTLAQIQERKWSTYMGVDIARSASVGADYFVIYTIAKDNHGFHYIVDIDRTKGLPFKTQLEKIAMNARRYDPGLIFIESNAMQQVYTDEMRRMTDFPVKEFVTLATNKYPLDRGVPGLRILLENEKIVIPRGDAYSRKMTDTWIEEMSQFGYIDGKLQGIGSHDDCVMSFWFACEAAKAGGFSFAFGDEVDDDEEEDLNEDWESVMLGTEAEREDGDSAFGT